MILEFWPAFLLGCATFDANAPLGQATMTFPLLSTTLPFLSSLGRLLARVSYAILPHWNLGAACRVRGLSDLVVIVGDGVGVGVGDGDGDGDGGAGAGRDADADADADGVGDGDADGVGDGDASDSETDSRSSRIPSYICLPARMFRTMMM